MADARLQVAIERRFRGGPTIRAAFELDTASAETLVLFGPSGVGKTTVLRCLAGLERPDAGRIVLGDEVWFDAAAGVDRPPQRRRIGYLPQGHALFPHLDVAANIAFGIDDVRGAARTARVAELVARFGLSGLERRKPAELSGGQRQRVALARALARRPQLLLLDEPLSALDAPTRERLRLELRELLAAGGVSAIVVTHDRTEALVLGDRVAVMVDGVVRQSGRTLEVFDRPADEAVARVTGVETVLAGRVVTVEDGLAAVAVDGLRLTAIGDAGPGDRVLLFIRAEDVLLSAVRGAAASEGTAGFGEGGRGSSARNRLVGRVVGLEPHGPVVRVGIDVGGVRLVAAVTRPAVVELGLAPARLVEAEVKATAIGLVRLAAAGVDEGGSR